MGFLGRKGLKARAPSGLYEVRGIRGTTGFFATFTKDGEAPEVIATIPESTMRSSAEVVTALRIHCEEHHAKQGH